MKIKEYGDRIETCNDKNQLHSFDDKPAIKFNNGDKWWHKEGELHRLDGPAVEWGDRCKEWYKEEKLHRLNGPAREIYSDEDEEDKEWCKEWYEEGILHRLDGPAYEHCNNEGDEDEFRTKRWYCKGKDIECNSTEEFLKIINLKAFW